MSDDAPAQGEITEVRDTHTGATLHLEGLSDRAARYVAWRHWFAMVDTDIPAGKRGHAELARLEVTPLPTERRPVHLTRELVWRGQLAELRDEDTDDTAGAR